MEIERKFLISKLPENLSDYPFHQIEQGYLTTNPVVRIRRQDDDYILTYKGNGMMAREEYNLPLNQASYEHLLTKVDGIVLTKQRFLIPLPGTSCTAELDIFSGHYKGLMLVEVEFETEEQANAFVPPEWFGKDVTFSGEYQNSRLASI